MLAIVLKLCLSLEAKQPSQGKAFSQGKHQKTLYHQQPSFIQPQVFCKLMEH